MCQIDLFKGTTKRMTTLYLGVFLVAVWTVLLTSGHAAPMATYMGDSDTDINADMQRLLMNQELKREAMGKWPIENESVDEDLAYNGGGFRRLIAQKRLEAQKRTNRGGVSLCLWKVCPAGPWLVSK